MKIDKRTVVFNKKNGDKWVLYPTQNPDRVYLKCIDGKVPNGQEINLSTAESLFLLEEV